MATFLLGVGVGVFPGPCLNRGGFFSPTVIVKIVDRKNVPVCQKTPKSSRIFTVQHFFGGFFCVSSFWFFGFFFSPFHRVSARIWGFRNWGAP